ncbi:ABC transporter ATP-binding protein [Aeromicrobium sp. Root236]|uniref:ABC transporter ATP-binding protein n=1 Tax=Aeromicrobium sp. Root236 TaxID=1736498 RepID=UPI0012F7DA65|nr:ABC transporter ATP-binding protein [Aeromicrobium sp. Root236]
MSESSRNVRRSRAASSASELGEKVDTATLLEVRDLHVEFSTRSGVAKALNGVSWGVARGQTLAILGESGSGKSVTAQAIMGILDTPPARVTGGQVLFDGRDLLSLSDDERRAVRGSGVAMIFQDALSALNPVFPVGWQITEALRVRQGMSRKDSRIKAVELLDRVRIPAASARVDDYPHQFSGGMRQRVMIAMALSLDPQVLIADEPTTALDVTVQAQIMQLLSDLQRESDMGLVLITHDLGVVAQVADDIAVMYAGRVVERGPAADLYRRPGHPYTRGLLQSIPSLEDKGKALRAIPGLPPTLTDLPKGCAFQPRCGYANQERCVTEQPVLQIIDAGREAACHHTKRVLDDQL